MKILLLLIAFTYSLLALRIPDGDVDITHFELHYLQTKKHEFTLENIQEKEFTQTAPSNHSFGMIKDKDIWIKLELQTGATPKKLYIQQADTVNSSDIKFYLLKNNKIIAQLKDGVQNGATASDAVMVVDVDAKSHYTLFAKISTQASLILNMNIYDEAHYYSYKKYFTFGFGIFMGVVFGLLLYNFYLYFALRYIQYLYYSLFVLFTSIYFMAHTGAILEFFAIPAIYYEYLYYSYFPMGISFILFLQTMLQTKKYMPNVDKFLTLIIVSIVLDLLYYTFISNIMAYQYKSYYIILGVVLFLPFFYLWAIYKKVPLIKLFLLASLPKDLMVFPSIFIFLGWVDFSCFSRYAYGYALVYEVIAYSILIAYYIKNIQEENTLQKLLLSQKEKQAALGELLIYITHQWRTPLATLSSLLITQQVKLQNNVPITENDLHKYIQKSQKAIQFMSETISNFVSFYSPDKTLKRFNISNAINTIVTIIEKDLLCQNIDLQVKGDESLTFYGAQNDLSQIILALISNAKYIFKQRDIKNGKIEIGFYKKDDYIIIEVSDNAGGIQLKPISSLFEPFQSTKSSTQSGIGLYMAKKILNSYNSTISAINENGGAKFTITLQGD